MNPARRAAGAAALVLLAAGLGAPVARAHGDRVGALRIEHPYALPTPPGARTGAAYLKAIVNAGDQPDQLLSASSPVADAVEFHRSEVDAQQIARMRQLPAIDIPARGTLALRHDGRVHLMLVGLKAPLRAGERIDLTLRFARAGEVTVSAWVQLPRNAGAEHTH